MTFFEAVFYPFAIWALLGVAAAVVPYFLPALREKKKWPIACFILIAFLVMLFWRMGMSVGKRHQMTLFVPAILLAVYFLSFIRDLALRKRFFRHYYWIFPALFLICLCICTGKSLRVREKPYLAEICRILRQEKSGENTIFIAIGKIGGVLPFDKKLQMLCILPENHEITEKTFVEIEQQLSPSLLRKRYKTIVFLVVETGKDALFQQTWTQRYGDHLQLQYEYSNPRNDRYYRLYRFVVPENVRRWKSDAEMLAEFRSKNLIRNPELRTLTRLTPETAEVAALKRRGTRLDLPADGIPWPADWKINLQYGWRPACLPANLQVMEISSGRHILLIAALAPISLVLPCELAAGHRYWILSGVSGGFSGCGDLYGLFYDENKKNVSQTIFQNFDLQQSTKYRLIEVDLRQRKSGAMKLFIRLFRGEGIVNYCFAIRADE